MFKAVSTFALLSYAGASTTEESVKTSIAQIVQKQNELLTSHITKKMEANGIASSMAAKKNGRSLTSSEGVWIVGYTSESSTCDSSATTLLETGSYFEKTGCQALSEVVDDQYMDDYLSSINTVEVVCDSDTGYITYNGYTSSDCSGDVAFTFPVSVSQCVSISAYLYTSTNCMTASAPWDTGVDGLTTISYAESDCSGIPGSYSVYYLDTCWPLDTHTSSMYTSCADGEYTLDAYLYARNCTGTMGEVTDEIDACIATDVDDYYYGDGSSAYSQQYCPDDSIPVPNYDGSAGFRYGTSYVIAMASIVVAVASLVVM